MFRSAKPIVLVLGGVAVMGTRLSGQAPPSVLPDNPLVATPTRPRAAGPTLSLSEQLANAQALLQSMELRLTPAHTDILREKRIIAELQQRVQNENAVPLIPTVDSGLSRGSGLDVERQLADRGAEIAKALKDLRGVGTTDEQMALQQELTAIAIERYDFNARLDPQWLAFQGTTQVPRSPGSPQPFPQPAVVTSTGRGRAVGIAVNDEERLYQTGIRSLDNQRWSEAIDAFNRVVTLAGPRADGATYWIAWGQNKQGDGAAALATLGRLRQSYPNSRWVSEARALDVEIRQAAGQPVKPENVPDDDLKLVALNSLMRAEEQRAIPMIDKILRGTGSPKLKERALFVLAQNSTPQARQMVTEIAKGAANPDLQARAVSYLGVYGGAESKQALLDIYKSSSSLELKRSILRAFMTTGDRARLLEVARTEQSPELRAEAVSQLGAMGAQEEVAQLYQSDLAPAVRMRIIQSMFTGHNEAKLIQLLRSESNEDLKRSIIQNLGMMASPASADALVSQYASEKSPNVRQSVIDALAQQRNSKALIDLAKKETDPALKKRIVDRLATMKSAEATDYFLEILSKP